MLKLVHQMDTKMDTKSISWWSTWLTAAWLDVFQLSQVPSLHRHSCLGWREAVRCGSQRFDQATFVGAHLWRVLPGLGEEWDGSWFTCSAHKTHPRGQGQLSQAVLVLWLSILSNFWSWNFMESNSLASSSLLCQWQEFLFHARRGYPIVISDWADGMKYTGCGTDGNVSISSWYHR